MAAGTRQANTQEENLRKLLPMITEMKLAEDVDPDFVTELETRVIGKIREPLDRANAMSQAAQQMPGMGGPAPAAPMPAPMGAGPTPAAPTSEAGGIPIEVLAQMLAAQQQAPAAPNQRGLRPSPAMPPPDELRRILTPQ